MFQANIIFPYSISELLKCIYLCFYFDTPLAAVTWSFSSQWDKPRMILFDINVPRWHFADECQYDIISPHPGALISTDYIQYSMSILPIGVDQSSGPADLQSDWERGSHAASLAQNWHSVPEAGGRRGSAADSGWQIPSVYEVTWCDSLMM